MNFHGKPLGFGLAKILKTSAFLLASVCWLLSSPTEAATTLKVGNELSYPPFEMQQNGEEVGFDIDLVREAAKRAGYSTEFRSMTLDGIIPALQAGQIDIGLAGLTINPARQKVVDFSIPYFVSGIVIATAASTTGISTLNDLTGKRVAVVVGNVGAKLAQEAPNAANIRILPFDNNENTYLAVEHGNADATLNHKDTLDYYIAKQGKGKLKIVSPLLTNDFYGIAFRRGADKEREAIDRAILNMAKDGTYAKLYEKWFGTQPDVLPGQFKK
jgi:ABC-type amino acid transport substrate-binding protein